ncbi:MAG: MarR family transcriptional regulator [Acidimicrobiia bacterium]|nr:MarR family transcriptional regulator [Acidimicrobiia bacterium]
MSSNRQTHPHIDPAEIAAALRLSIGRLARRLRQESVGDLTPSQRSILFTLDRHGPLRMGELAAIEKISAPSVTGIVGRLEERGLVDRQPDPNDARSTLVRPTETATTILAAARQLRTAFLTTRLASMQDSEISTLVQAMALLDRIAADE